MRIRTIVNFSFPHDVMNSRLKARGQCTLIPPTAFPLNFHLHWQAYRIALCSSVVIDQLGWDWCPIALKIMKALSLFDDMRARVCTKVNFSFPHDVVEVKRTNSNNALTHFPPMHAGPCHSDVNLNSIASSRREHCYVRFKRFWIHTVWRTMLCTMQAASWHSFIWISKCAQTAYAWKWPYARESSRILASLIQCTIMMQIQTNRKLEEPTSSHTCTGQSFEIVHNTIYTNNSHTPSHF